MKKLMSLDKKWLAVIVAVLFSFGIIISIVGSLVPDTLGEIKQKKIDSQFSYDGSHKLLKSIIKEKLATNDNFTHIRTNYSINDDCIIVKMDFSVINVFGVKIQYMAIGFFKIDGTILKITYGLKE